MASEYVIELGSSDDEAEPAPKKIKPMTNAMVHIPNKLPGITIKPAIPKTVHNIPKGLAGKPLTITKVTNQHMQNRNKINGKTPQNLVIKQNFKPVRVLNKLSVNPLCIGVPHFQGVGNKPIKYLKRPIQIQGSSKPLTNLPASITVKKTIVPTKRIAVTNFANIHKKPKVAPNAPTGKLLTVELDEDEVSPATAHGPQWYIRPEEEDSKKLEKLNNTEPAPSNLIEITIEDSPSKPIQTKRAHEVGAELAITIDDSPVKAPIEKKLPSSDSDDSIQTSKKVPHSKKKLKYPRGHGSNVGDTVEIEIELPQDKAPTLAVDNNKEDAVEKVSIEDDGVVIIEESPAKQEEIIQTCTPKKKSPPKTQVKIRELEIDTQKAKESGEFHPVYQSFINLCFQLENSDDMTKIVEKKIKAYYKQVPKEYTESEQFIDMVSGKIISMKAGPEKMYLYIKDVVDELNLQRKVAKSQAVNDEAKNKEAEQFLYGEDSEFDSKRQRQIRKLEKTLKKLHRAIQKLEEQEVDFDDDEDSVYLLTERYKERMVRVHAKFCQLTNTKMPSEPRVQIDARPGQPSGPAKRLEKWINKKVPIGTPLPFPDFHDVLRCVKEANEEDKLGWNDVDIMEEARDLFTRCGKKLQRRRQENEWRLAASRIPIDVDPAEHSEDLKKMLEQNRLLATKKETDVYNKFAKKQNELNLEAEEIGDKDADESPVDSEDEDANDVNTSLEDKRKRKERLRRLLNEKSKKNVEEKENNPVNESSKSQDVQDTTPLNTTEDQSKVNEPEIDMQVNNSTNLQTNVEEDKIDNDKVQCLSDDSSKIESDIDELHLLQKLHSGNEVNSSTLDSSDSDTPIAISDTLDSSSDNKKPQSDDIISIENSSYSESDINKDSNESKESKDLDCPPIKDVTEAVIDTNIETECSTSGVDKIHNKSNNDEYNMAVENILLASSDDESSIDINKSPNVENMCVNLKDDSLSIGETTIESTEVQKDSLNQEEKEQLVATEFQKGHDVNKIDASAGESYVYIPQDNTGVEMKSNQNADNQLDKLNKTVETSHSPNRLEPVQMEIEQFAVPPTETQEESNIISMTEVITADTTTAINTTEISDDNRKQIHDSDITLDEVVESSTDPKVDVSTILPTECATD